MRLILQPKSTKKAATPYKDVAEKLFRFRFFILFRVYILVSLFALVFSRKIALTVFVCFSLVALNRKFSAHTTAVYGSSRFNELYNRLICARFARSLLLYIISALVYFVFVARPNGNLYTVEMVAGIPANARGLNKAIKDGLISHTLVYLNENIVLCLFDAFAVAIAYAIYEAVCDKTRLWFKTRDVSPRDALFSNYLVFVIETMYCCRIVYPIQVLYWILRPISLMPFYAAPLGRYSVAGTTPPSKWGAAITYPLQWSLLIFVWAFGSRAFDAYYCRGPIHHGKTISQGSSEPNATLITGIKDDRKTLANLEAWLELENIGSLFKERRVEIYADAGNEKPAWKLIYQVFDQYITTVNEALSNLLPKKAVAPLEEKPAKLAKTTARTIKISNKHVLADKPSAVDQIVFKLQSEAEEVKVWGPLKNRATAKIAQVKAYLMQTQYAGVFEVTNERKVHEVLLDEGVLRSAIAAISHLIVNSYDEDTMGYVQTDIGNALSRYDQLLTIISRLRRDLGVSLDELEGSATSAFDSVCDRFRSHFDSMDIPDSVKTRANYL